MNSLTNKLLILFLLFTFLLYFLVILITQEGCSLIDTCHVFIIDYYIYSLFVLIIYYIINLILLL